MRLIKSFLLTIAIVSAIVLGEKANATTFAVLGDSYSTFEGYMTDASAPCFYGPEKGAVNDVNLTWWKRFEALSGYTMVANNSYSGATISNTVYTTPEVPR